MKKFIIPLFILVSVLYACSSSDDSGGDDNGGTTSFDRGALLAHTADNIIIPALQDLQSKLVTLKTTVDTFTTTPNQDNLNAASTAWLEAYKVWQHVEMFNIGEAETLNEYYFFMNIYPTNVEDIQNAVSSGSYNLNSSNYHDAQGFPAIDYLLHSNNALSLFTSESAEGYKNYLKAVVDQMVSLTDQVATSWTPSYRNVFTSSTENTATGAFNKLINDFVFYYEKGFRANKFGIPAGVFSDSTLPNQVEALYKKDVSKTLALEAMTAIKNMFNGVSYGSSATGVSYKTYLEALNRSDLVTTLNNTFDNARTAINGLNTDFNQQVITDNSKMTQTYDAIQTAVPYLKADMMQTFNVVLDYQDADGD